MKLFIDSAEIKEIEEAAATGLIDGVTTNPSLIAKSGRPFAEAIKEICALVDGPVSAEVAATDFDGMVAEGRALGGIAENVTVKLPLTWEGLRACKTLSEDGFLTNVTLCFSATQALMAAKAGATFVSPFIGRHDDVGFEGMQLIRDIKTIYDHYEELETEILVASVRHPLHVRDAAMTGAHVATLPPAIFKALLNHPLTDKGLAAFLADWQKTGQTVPRA
ncbi:MAG TPA: fructose-6-phosphate aldolase [Alphaproteobacteria bacterium]|nr:fructose-6-phosphate aldolase [Alphaproteobacteria bacterium]